MSKNDKNFCKNCGNELQQSDNFCNKCGTKVVIGKNAKRKNTTANLLIYVVSSIFVFILFMMIVLKKDPASVAPSGGTMSTLSLQNQQQSVHTFINDLKAKISQDPNDITTIIVLANFFA